jgi:hypothetical protein
MGHITNTSREIRRRFTWIKKVYWYNEFWSPGFFSSTVGINEEIIKRYIEFQEKIDKGQLQLFFNLQCHGREPVGIYSILALTTDAICIISIV